MSFRCGVLRFNVRFLRWVKLSSESSPPMPFLWEAISSAPCFE